MIDSPPWIENKRMRKIPHLALILFLNCGGAATDDAGNLVCGESQTFNVSFLDAETKAAVTFPIAASFTNNATGRVSAGRHGLNETKGVYRFDDIVLCDEYRVGVAVVCYLPLAREDFEVPRSTLWTIELQPASNCRDYDLQAAFAACLQTQSLPWCCDAFPQDQFSLQCGRD